MKMSEAQRAIARGGMILIGLVLILAAVAEFAIAPLELVFRTELQHTHRPAWLTAAFLFGGILLAFPAVAQRLYEWAKPFIPKISFGRGTQ